MRTAAEQAAYRAAQTAKGLCIECTKPAVNGSRCREHALKHREVVRTLAGCRAWREGRPGRPPKIR